MTVSRATATKRLPHAETPRLVPPGTVCQDCGGSRTGEGYAVPARRTDTGNLVLARSGEVWRCGACSLLAFREGR